jgi:hypothetical protein
MQLLNAAPLKDANETRRAGRNMKARPQAGTTTCGGSRTPTPQVN